MPISVYVGLVIIISVLCAPVAMEIFIKPSDKKGISVFARWVFSVGLLFLLTFVLQLSYDFTSSMAYDACGAYFVEPAACPEWLYQYQNDEFGWTYLAALAFTLPIYILCMFRIGRFICVAKS